VKGMPALYPVCEIDEIDVGGSLGFSIATKRGQEDIFLLRTAQSVLAYRNSCPHTGGPLDWVPNQFLNLDGDLIQCATHAALFRIGDGMCVRGPCAGQRLQALRLDVSDGFVSVELDFD